MKIKYFNATDGAGVHLDAENSEEIEFLYRFFRGYCKRLAKRFPLKDKEWKGEQEVYNKNE